MRCTAPMKAPSPPPTIPSLILPPFLASLRPSMAMIVSPYFSPSARLICFLSIAAHIATTLMDGQNHGSHWTLQPIAPRRSTTFSATRQALAMIVKVGLAPVPVGNGAPSTT